MRPPGVVAAIGAAYADSRRRSRHRLPSHPLPGMFLLPSQAVRAVPGLQEGRRHRRVRAGGRRLFAVCARDGLDRPARRGEDSRRRLVRSRLLRRAGEYLREGRGPVDPQPEERRGRSWARGRSGLLFTMLVKRSGATMVATDTMPYRRRAGRAFRRATAPGSARPPVAGAHHGNDRRPGRRLGDCRRFRARHRRAGGALSRGPAAGFCCSPKPRTRSASSFPAPTSAWENGHIFGSYSASVDLQKQSANLVFGGALPVEDLISHRFPLNEIRAGIELALHPDLNR